LMRSFNLLPFSATELQKRSLTVLNLVLVEGIKVILFLEGNSCTDIAEWAYAGREFSTGW